MFLNQPFMYSAEKAEVMSVCERHQA